MDRRAAPRAAPEGCCAGSLRNRDQSRKATPQQGHRERCTRSVRVTLRNLPARPAEPSSSTPEMRPRLLAGSAQPPDKTRRHGQSSWDFGGKRRSCPAPARTGLPHQFFQVATATARPGNVRVPPPRDSHRIGPPLLVWSTKSTVVAVAGSSTSSGRSRLLTSKSLRSPFGFTIPSA